ncbi:uncharacterized protein RHOBADRAFT_50896 [Rhodotorula graminis WP1]|uniref:Uncharacterized protein n=1 Tax=Rhodotorula graminis (strain WP1) TaxID=578459 RepID=A0A194SCV9_RHOGW|nr:uncharacterized protein RHOBADRAFT_50896 [Rhodotorula graminis WP1]KPV78427.1 hypothetical protein RHOBADRAFT_50896 [Rhodotorula graminis WP1]
MPFDEIQNVLSSRSLNSPSLLVTFAAQGSSGEKKEQVAWKDGRKTLVPVPVGEAKRLKQKQKGGLDISEQAVATCEGREEPCSPSSTDAVSRARRLVEENRRLRESLVHAEENASKHAYELVELRNARDLAIAERDSLRLDMTKQEDELFILRQSIEERTPGSSELRRALAAVESQRDLALDAKSQLEAQHELSLSSARAENEQLRQELVKAESDVEQSRADQNEQHQACMQLMEEQDKLELAYEEILHELDELKRQRALDEGLALDSLVEQGAEDCLDDADQSWDHVELDDLVSPPGSSTTRKSVRKSAFGRALTKRARTRSQPLLGAPLPPHQDVAAVKNDVEQLKQTIALLVRERRPAVDVACDE